MKKLISLLLVFFLVLGVASATNVAWDNGGDDITSFNDCKTTHTTFDKKPLPCKTHYSIEAMPTKSKISDFSGGQPVNYEYKTVQIIPVDVIKNMDTFYSKDQPPCEVCNNYVHAEAKPHESGTAFRAGNTIIKLIKSCFVN